MSRKHGKLLIIDPKDERYFQVFFDDSIYADLEGEKCILDVRDLHSGNTIPSKDVFDKNIFKVDTINAILDVDYYINKVESILKFLD